MSPAFTQNSGTRSGNTLPVRLPLTPNVMTAVETPDMEGSNFFKQHKPSLGDGYTKPAPYRTPISGLASTPSARCHQYL